MGKFFRSLIAWVDSSNSHIDQRNAGKVKFDWMRSVPFIAFHIAALGVLFVSFSWFAVAVMAFMYFIRMFAITGFYHRYFSHRTFETSRTVQFVMGVIGNSCVQRSPAWWASHHRHHHKYSDQEQDNHSPVQQGFLWSHLGWIFSFSNIPTRSDIVPDLLAFREMRFLDRFDWVVPVLFGVGMFVTGNILGEIFPGLHTNGPQLLFWGFFLSTVLLFHGTFFINSLAHVWGVKRYETGDTSRNNFWLALITLGEGWHNNHHYYPNAARQGFFWYEIDISYYLLRLMALFGLIWNVKEVPPAKLYPGKAAR